MSNPLNGILGSSGGGSGGSGIVGSTGATDLGIIIANGTGGSTVQASAATLTTGGSLTIPSGQKLQTPSIYSGALDANNAYLTILGVGSEPAYKIWSSSNYGLSLGSTGDFNAHVRLWTGGVVVSRTAEGQSRIALVGPSPSRIAASQDTQIGWTSDDTAATSSLDTGLARNSAAVVRVSNGSTGIGSLLSSVLVEANTAGSGTPNAIAATESGTVFTNEGVTAKNYHTLPSAVAGYKFTFIVQDADGMRIVANTDDTIRVIDKVTAAAGYIESTTIGSVVTLIAINATEWIATSIHGTWTDGTWSYDDTSLTTP